MLLQLAPPVSIVVSVYTSRYLLLVIFICLALVFLVSSDIVTIQRP